MTELDRDFLSPSEFYSDMKEQGLHFYTGVPDSLLKDFCAYVTAHAEPDNHVIAANEGSAVGIAAGYHMATGQVPLVYMQNSGIGNSINPLLSLADPNVYGFPMVVMIGWRGEPGKKDEPQHLVQGKYMVSMLASMNLNFEVLPDYAEGAQTVLKAAIAHAKERQAPSVLLVRKQTFLPFKPTDQAPIHPDFDMNRETALEHILTALDSYDAVVGTTGFASREIMEVRQALGHHGKSDFLSVGSMGHAPAIALGLSIGKPSRRVVCIDGDGGAIMHLGNMTTIGQSARKNMRHVLINNGCHESVGAQPTAASCTDFAAIAKACGYANSMTVSSEEELLANLGKFLNTDGPSFLEVKVKPGTRSDLGRPKNTPKQSKHNFMGFLRE